MPDLPVRSREAGDVLSISRVVQGCCEKERGFRTKAGLLKPLLYTVDRIEDHVMPSAGISVFSNPKLLVQILILLDNFEKDFVATSCGSFPTQEARVVCWLN